MQFKKRPVLKNDSLIERYPKTFGVCFTVVCFSMLLSRHIYDFVTGFGMFMREREFKKKYTSKGEITAEE